MSRKDYDEIKLKFAEFVRTWRTHEIALLDELAVKNVECRISGSPHSNQEWDFLEGLKTFVSLYPKTDVLQLSIYTFSCYLKDDQAQQVAHVVCESMNEIAGREELDVFYYSIHCANHWIKEGNQWKMDVVHMDIYPFYWTSDDIYQYFCQTWYFGSKLAIDCKDGRLPAIEGEFDLPWCVIDDPEDVLTEPEKIKDCYAKLFFSADYMVNEYRILMRSRHLDVNSMRYGNDEGIRRIVGSLRYKRQRDRYWSHPYRFGNQFTISEDGKHAICDVYRVFGWKQRNHEYVWTKANVNIEHMCMAGWQEFVKEDGIWKLASSDLRLGLYEVGPYSESLYGDLI